MRIENPNSRRHRIANPMQLRNPTQRKDGYTVSIHFDKETGIYTCYAIK